MNPVVVSVDPGSSKSGVTMIDVETRDIVWFDNEMLNEEVVDKLDYICSCTDEAQCDVQLVIEMIVSYGNKQGKSIHQTLVWIGRFIQRWLDIPRSKGRHTYYLITRPAVKQALLGTDKGDDADVGFALRVRYNEPPAPRHPKGRLKGIASHGMQALGVGIAYIESVLKLKRQSGWVK